MIMIPLPFVFGLAALGLALREWMYGAERNYWMVTFLVFLALQEFIIGARFGYQLEFAMRIQPLVAAVVPALAYLAFRRPKLSHNLWVHLLPLIVVCLALAFLIDALDAILAANNFAYVVLLILLGLRGSDGLAWVPFARMRTMQVFLWLVVALMAFSGLIDAVISLDFQANDGANTARIVGVASALGIPVLAGVFLFARRWRQNSEEEAAFSNEDKDTFEQVQKLMKEDRLFIDPEINLTRIARRMRRPSRDISRAINACAQQNVSQYVNSLRIAEACELLKESDMAITEVVYASGYNSKSNFHREFTRVAGMTPSEWRRT